ncbi:MAG: hypothetical protein Q8R36_02895 [bacterium]|nr:hypothetical protein [bacterium]
MKKNNFIVILIFLFLFVCGEIVLWYLTIRPSTNTLKTELSSFIVPPISIYNNQYFVERGNVRSAYSVYPFEENIALRIAHAIVLNKFDPLFAIEGTDPQELKLVVEKLDASLNEISALFNAKEQAIIKDTFYPISFLNALSENEKLRQEFIHTPSYARSLKYYQSLKRVIDLYDAYAERLKFVFQNISTNSQNATYNFIGGNLTPSSYVSLLENIRAEIKNRKSELKKRTSCLRYFSSSCPSLKTAFYNFTQPHVGATPIKTDRNAIPSTIFQNKNIIDAYFEISAHDKKILPILVLQSSSCFVDFSPVYYKTRKYFNDDVKNKVFEPIFLNDIYFYDARNHPSPYIIALRKKGIEYVYQTITNLYMCPDIEEDYFRLITLDTIRELLLKNKLFANDKTDSVNIAAGLLEKRIIASETVYEVDMIAYVDALKLLLRKLGEAELSRSMGEDKVLYIEKLLSIYNQKTPRLDEVLANVILDNNIINALVRMKSGTTLNQFFLGRSYPTLFLLTYNQSVVTGAPKLLQSKTLNLTDFRLVSYVHTLKNIYSVANVLDIIRRGRESEKLLLKQFIRDVEREK